MTKEEVREDVLYKTHTAIEKLSDGSCIKRVTVTKNGKTEVKEEKVDCEAALEDARGIEGKDEKDFEKENDEFDKKTREKLFLMNKSFSDQTKPTILHKEEIYTDGANKTVKVTRESSSIEETKKTEKIPDGTKRILKITRESFLEETKKSVSPETMLPEELNERVKVLEDNFNEEGDSKSTTAEKGEPESQEDKLLDKANSSELSKDGKKVTFEETDGSEEDNNEETNERLLDNNMEIVQADDSILKKFVKAVFKIIFYPLYALNIL